MRRQEEYSDELLSAYLDGQLSDGEKAAVEARLARDPDARELVSRFRAAAQAVRDLPRVAAPRDLKDAVLQAAARQGGESDAPGSAGEAAPAGGRSTWNIGRSPRAWLWAGLAVAAALLIMFLEHDGPRERHLARQQREAAEPAEPAPPAEPPENRGVAADARGRARENADLGLSEVEQLERISPPAQAESSTTTPELAAGEPLSLSEGEAMVEEDTERVELREAAPADADSRRSLGLERAQARGGEADRAGRASDFFDPRENVATNARLYKLDVSTADDSGATSVVLDNPEVAFNAQAGATEAHPPAYLVSVNVTPEAIRNNVVPEVLSQNSIALVKLSSGDAETANGRPLQEQEGPPAAANAPDLKAWNEQQVGQRVAEPAAGRPAGPAEDESEVIAVEASSEQVAALLSQLSTDVQHVRALAVLTPERPAEGEPLRQVPLRYNRNAEQALSPVAGAWQFVPRNDTPGETGAPRAAGPPEPAPGGESYRYGYGGGYGGAVRRDAQGGYQSDGRNANGALADTRGDGSRPEGGLYGSHLAYADQRALQQARGRAWFVSPRQVRAVVSPERLGQSATQQRWDETARPRVPAETDGATAEAAPPAAKRPREPAEPRRKLPDEPSAAPAPGLGAQGGTELAASTPEQVRMVLFFNVIPDKAALAAEPVQPTSQQSEPNTGGNPD